MFRLLTMVRSGSTREGVMQCGDSVKWYKLTISKQRKNASIHLYKHIKNYFHVQVLLHHTTLTAHRTSRLPGKAPVQFTAQLSRLANEKRCKEKCKKFKFLTSPDQYSADYIF